MMISRRSLLGTAAAISLLPPARAEAATIKIGMMNGKGAPPDQPIYPSQAVAEFTVGKDLKVENSGGQSPEQAGCRPRHRPQMV
jgi:hypothetical protein